jgi:hypothetical protein
VEVSGEGRALCAHTRQSCFIAQLRRMSSKRLQWPPYQLSSRLPVVLQWLIS